MQSPQPGQVIEETKRTRVVSADEPTKDSKRAKPPIWDYIETLTPEDWRSHELYVYRSTNGDPANYSPIAKYFDPVDQFRVFSDLGGGFFKFMLKKEKVLIYNQMVKWEGSPKDPPDRQPSHTNGNGNGTRLDPSMMGEVRGMVMDILREIRGGASGEDANRAALNLQGDVLKSTVPAVVEAIRSVTGVNQQNVQTPESRLRETMELFTIMKNAFAPAAPVNSIKETLETITALKGAGLLGTGEKTSVGTELLRQLPNALHYLSTAVATWADAQKHTVDAQLAMQNKALPPAPPIQIPPPPAAATAENPATTEKPVRNPMIDIIEGTILKIVLDMHADNQPLGDIVDEVIQTLDNYPVPELVQKIAQNGKQNLLQQFGESPILKNLPPEPWRTQFVELFLKKAAEMRAGPKPN